jgi:hypothetical protein
MRTYIVLSIPAVATILMSAAPGHLGSIRNGEPEEISRLNECIQQRFLDRRSFGMRRILPNQYHGDRTFRPENPTELSLVNQLQEKGYELALYLAGRSILTELPPSVLGIDLHRFGVQGPAYITRLRNPDALPERVDLLEQSRAALASFESGEGYDIRKGAWTVAMRPLRASNVSCVLCHAMNVPTQSNPRGQASLKEGDPLGVAIYVYRQVKHQQE